MMKKALILLSVVVIAAAPLRSSLAGDREWATAGKVIAGLAALAIIGDLIADEHPVCVPAPPRYRAIRVHAPQQVWVEGRYVEVVRRVWVPPSVDRIWVPPVRRQVWVATPCGGYWQDTIVRRGFYRTVRRPGHFVDQRETRWVPGQWERI